MTGLTNYITQKKWSNIFLVWYVLVDDAWREVVSKLTRPVRSRGPEPLMSDSEVITVGLAIESMFGGDEELGLSFLRQYHPDLFPHLLENSRFNRRRRDLACFIEAVRQQITTEYQLISESDRVRLVDSVPIPVCTYMRSGRCMTVAGKEYCGVMVSRRAKLFGFRAYVTTTPEGVVDQWLLAPASFHDSKITPALLQDCANMWVLGDNAFHDHSCAEWLKADHNITLVAMPRMPRRSSSSTTCSCSSSCNGPQKGDMRVRELWPSSVRYLFKRLRRRIESAFAVLSTVFHLEQPGSRSLTGLIARTSTRILAYNISFLASPLLNTF